MMTPETALADLARRRPEWASWLAVIEGVLSNAGGPEWEAAVPADVPAPRSATPLLAGVTLTPRSQAMHRLLTRALRSAAQSGSEEMATLRGVLRAELDGAALFEASVCQDADRVKSVAAECAADADALHAVIALVSWPLLHACRRRWAGALSASWVEGYCPLCAAWPAFAEIRGIEQRRFFRCGRCGVEWHARLLRCPYCATADHGELASLVPEQSGVHAAIDACRRCHGYVKVFNVLQGCSPETVIIHDLDSVALDVAALAQGFARPAGAAYPLSVTVAPTRSTGRFFAWKA